jgi:hypothetical protein
MHQAATCHAREQVHGTRRGGVRARPPEGGRKDVPLFAERLQEAFLQRVLPLPVAPQGLGHHVVESPFPLRFAHELHDAGFDQTPLILLAKPGARLLGENEEAGSPLAKRPYDLRLAALSAWLSAGADPQAVARRAGHSVAVLLRVYARLVHKSDDAINAKISARLRQRR